MFLRQPSKDCPPDFDLGLVFPGKAMPYLEIHGFCYQSRLAGPRKSGSSPPWLGWRGARHTLYLGIRIILGTCPSPEFQAYPGLLGCDAQSPSRRVAWWEPSGRDISNSWTPGTTPREGLCRFDICVGLKNIFAIDGSTHYYIISPFGCQGRFLYRSRDSVADFNSSFARSRWAMPSSIISKSRCFQPKIDLLEAF